MKNLWRLSAVLPLRVRGSQKELRTIPPSTDSRLPAVFVCRLDFVCHLAFDIWKLCRYVAPPALRAPKNKWPTDETNRAYFNNRIGRLTYEKGFLNFRKNGNSHKTNHPRLCRVSSPALMARKDKRQTNETNRMYFKLNLTELIASRMKRAAGLQKKQLLLQNESSPRASQRRKRDVTGHTKRYESLSYIVG
jgi:hypothetical protein